MGSLEQELGWTLLIVKRPRRCAWVPVDQTPAEIPAGFAALRSAGLSNTRSHGSCPTVAGRRIENALQSRQRRGSISYRDGNRHKTMTLGADEFINSPGEMEATKRKRLQSPHCDHGQPLAVRSPRFLRGPTYALADRRCHRRSARQAPSQGPHRTWRHPKKSRYRSALSPLVRQLLRICCPRACSDMLEAYRPSWPRRSGSVEA